MQHKDKGIKLRYCKYCGTPLPPDSGKCFHCGKNNFRLIPPKFTPTSALAIVLAIGLTLVTIAAYNQSVKISELNGTILKLNEKYRDKAIFLDEHIAIITEAGEKYHKYGCQYIKGSFYIYDVDEVKARGYKPCATCY